MSSMLLCHLLVPVIKHFRILCICGVLVLLCAHFQFRSEIKQSSVSLNLSPDVRGNNVTKHSVNGQNKAHRSLWHRARTPELLPLEEKPELLPSQTMLNKSHLVHAMAKYASEDGSIMVSVVDLGFAEMALNLFLTCMKPQRVENYLIVAIHPDVCAILEAHHVHCFTYRTVEYSGGASIFNSKAYNVKTTMRAEVVLEALQAGFSVFLTDADAICFKNPFHYFNCSREDCDLATMGDFTHRETHYAVGCAYIHPTNASIHLYSAMTRSANKSIRHIDQVLFNKIIKRLKKLPPDFRIKKLSMSEFVNGRMYYDKRLFAADADPCAARCVMVQNNWVVTYEAKRYRAKELHHWHVDTDQYYTSTTRRYMTYNNPRHATDLHQWLTLSSAFAMGHILNRTVILPKFFCNKANLSVCNLLGMLQQVKQLRKLDALYHYREHSFLTHPLVPEKVRTSVLGAVFVANNSSLGLCTEAVAPFNVQRTSKVHKHNVYRALSSTEVIAHFKAVTESVLKIQCLYGQFDKLINEAESNDFKWNLYLMTGWQ